MGAGMGAARGGINYADMRQAIVDQLRTTAPNLIPAELARINEMEQKGLLARKTQTDIDTAALTQQETKLKLGNTKTTQFRDRLNNVNSPEAAARWTVEMYKDPHLKEIIGSVPLEDALAEIPKTPEAFKVWKDQNALGMTEWIKQNKPTTFAQDTGPGGRVMSFPGLGGPATVVPGSEFTKSMTFADRNAAARLAFEKANPSLSIQQTPTGFVAVNTTNGTAIPVVYGQAGFQAAGGAQPSPAAAPGASMMRQPPPTATPSQAIPGMPSVLDQAARPTAAPATLPIGTPGTPVMGKQSELKPIPANINLAILKNNQSIQQIDDTIKLLQKNPDATGAKGYLPNFALNRMDPEGTEARAGVADIGSIVLHDRSGAAVTAAEAPRLMPFIPLATDDNKTVIKKLMRMRNIAAQDQIGLTETYGKDQGYVPNPTVGKINAASGEQQIPPIYATNGKERIVSTDGGQTWNPVK
jgi:hypothetical protein